jgi:hypothetical protein
MRGQVIELGLHRGDPLELHVQRLPVLLDTYLHGFDERFQTREPVWGMWRLRFGVTVTIPEPTTATVALRSHVRTYCKPTS